MKNYNIVQYDISLASMLTVLFDTFNPIIQAITKTRNGESGKGIGEWGMRNGKTRNTKRGNL